MATVEGLDRYQILSAIGVGGMATVYLADDLVLGRKVALKRLVGLGTGELPEADRDRQGPARLRREALLGASVSHPNLVSIYDIFESDEGDSVVVMEYVAGETLRDRLMRRPRLSPAEALPILEGIAAGLDAIHSQGIVHRDVKPANVLLGDDGAVKLADLGIATASDRTRITSAGALLGTFRYMAPEQLEDAPSDTRTDIYALAAVGFEMLSGRYARQEENPMALAHAMANQPAPDLRDAWQEAPPAAAELLMAAMARDPAERPARAGELVARLREALIPAPTRAIRAHRPAEVPASAVVPGAAPATAMEATDQHLRPREPASPEGHPPLGSAVRPRRSPPPGPVAPSGKGWLSARRFLGPLLLAAVVLAAIVAVTLNLSSGNSKHRAGGTAGRGSIRTGAGKHAARTRAAGTSGSSTSQQYGASAGSAQSTPAAGTGASSGGASGANPVSAVESFYHLAAAHDYSAAWALADPTFRNQLEGYARFESGQAADRSFTFDSARVVSQGVSAATVAVQTTSVRTDGTQHCAGTVDLRRGGSGWLLHTISITCR